MAKAWFFIKWDDDFNLYLFDITTSHSNSKFYLNIHQADDLIKIIKEKTGKGITFEV